MTKKNFTTGLNSVLRDTGTTEAQPTEKKESSEEIPKTAEAQPTEEKQSRKEITKTTQEGTYEGEIRATFIINEAKLEKLKALAYWERTKQKDLIDQAIDMLLKSKDPELLEKSINEFQKVNSKAK